jgi:methionyl aminopeptidase
MTLWCCSQVLHYDNDEKITMKPGMCFTIEPILVEGDNEMFVWPDRWTAAARHGGW